MKGIQVRISGIILQIINKTLFTKDMITILGQ